MLQSVLHDDFEVATPSQRLAAAEHRRRMERIHSAAKVQRFKPFEPPPPQIPEEILPPIPNSEMKRALGMIEGGFVVNDEVKRIQRAVLRFFPDVTLKDIKSARRTAIVVKPRQIAMYLAKELTSRSLPDVGRRFGGRDHTTVLHAVRKYTQLVKDDPEVAKLVDEIKMVLSSEMAND